MSVSQVKRIAVVTATRAEFGLLSRLISLLEQSADFDCQLLVTGAHLSQEQGMTVNEIRESGNHITAEIPILDEEQMDSDEQVALITSRALAEFSKVFQQLQPDAVIVLGDRYELLGICSAALLMHVPIVHLHGGEITEGAMDDAIRHAITKMASLHFVAAEPYRKRVIQMGENPETIFNVGATGLDIIQHTDFLTKEALEQDLGIQFSKPLFLVTYHPVTLDKTSGLIGLKALFEAIENFPKATIIWTAANTDADGKILNMAVQEWADKATMNVKLVASLGSQRYLSLLKMADLVLGNSSSGIIEAPALGVPTVNIGDRQKGRLSAPSIIDCPGSSEAIQLAIKLALSEKFTSVAKKRPSIYGQGHTSQEIVSRLKQILIDENRSLDRKTFYDMNC